MGGIIGTTSGLVRAEWARQAEESQGLIAEANEREARAQEAKARAAAVRERLARIREAEQRLLAEANEK